MPRTTKSSLLISMLFLLIFTSACSKGSLPAPTALPGSTATAAPAQAGSTPAPTAPPAPSTPTAAPTPTQPPVTLPVRAGAYPVQDTLLGADSDQQPVELARWGRGIVNQVAVAPDGKSFAVATTAGVFFYDSTTYRQLSAYYTPSSVTMVRYTPDSRFLAAIDQQALHILRADDHTLLHSLAAGAPSGSGSLPFDISPDGKTIAAAAPDSVKVWEVETGNPVADLPYKTGAFLVKYLGDGSLMLHNITGQGLVNPQGTLVLVDPAAKTAVYTSQPFKFRQWFIAPAGNYGAVSTGYGDNDSLLIFDTATGKQLLDIAPKGRIYGAVFSPDGGLLSVSLGKRVCTWSVPRGAALACFDKFDYSAVVYHTDGQSLLVRAQKAIDIVDARSGAATSSLATSDLGAFLDVSSQGLFVVMGNNQLVVLAEDGKRKAAIFGFQVYRDFSDMQYVPAKAVERIYGVPTDQGILSLSAYYTITVSYDAATGESFSTQGKAVRAIAVSADAKTAVYADMKGFWLVDLTGGAVTQFAAETDFRTMGGFALSADGRVLAGVMRSNEGNRIRLWDTSSLEETGAIPLPDISANHFAFTLSPDGKKLAFTAQGPQERMLVYDISDPRRPEKIASLKDYVNSLAFTPDGSMLAVSTAPGKITFLDTSDFITPRLLVDAGFYLQAITFLDGGRVLAIAGTDNLVHLWGLPPDQGAQYARVEETPAAEAAGPALPLSLAGTPYPTPPAALSSAQDGSVVELARWGRGVVSGMAVAPDGTKVVVTSPIGAYLFDAQTLAELSFIPTGGEATGALFSPDSSLLAVLSRSAGRRTLYVWSLAENRLIYVQSIQMGIDYRSLDILPVDFSPDGQALAVLSDQDVLVLEARTGKRLQRRLLPGELGASALRYAAGGQSLVLISAGLFASKPGFTWMDPNSSAGAAHLAVTNMNTLDFSADGRYIAAGSYDQPAKAGKIQFIDAASGRPSGAEIALDAEPLSLAFSPAGDLLAASFSDGRLCLWSAPGGALQRCLLEEKVLNFWRVGFAGDGAYLVAANGPETRMWDTSDWSPRLGTPSTAQYIRKFHALPDGALLLLDDTGLSRWRIAAAPKFTASLPGAAAALLFSDDRKILAAAGVWGIQTWNVADGAHIDTIAAGSSIAAGAQALALSADGRLLAAAAPDGSVVLYELPGGKLRFTLAGLDQPAAQMHFVKGGQVLVAASQKEARLWDTTSGTELPAPQDNSANLLVLKDGGIYGVEGAWFGVDRDLVGRYWEIETGKLASGNPSMRGKFPDAQAISLAAQNFIVRGSSAVASFGSYGNKIWEAPLDQPAGLLLAANTAGDAVAAAGSGDVLLFNGKGEVARRFPGEANALALDPSGALLAYEAGGELQVWNTAITAEAASGNFEYGSGYPFGLSYAPTLRFFGEGFPDRPAILWSTGRAIKALDPANGGSIAEFDAGAVELAYSAGMSVEAYIGLTGKPGVRLLGGDKPIDGPAIKIPQGRTVSGLSLSADGRRLLFRLAGGASITFSLWDTQTGRPLSDNLKLGESASQAALSPDGNFVAVLSNRELLIYDITRPAAPKQVKQISQQNAQSLTFSQDGALLAVGDLQGKVTLFAAQSGWGRLASFQAHAGEVQSIIFLPGGGVLASAGRDGALRLWGIK